MVLPEASMPYFNKISTISPQTEALS